MTVNDFISKYSGKTIGYPDGSYVGECLSLVKVYIKEKYGFNPPPSGSNSAYGYWSNFPNPLGDYFTKVISTPTNFPKKGDIPIWNTNAGGGYGHISIAINGDANKFSSFDQNWNGKQAHIVEHNYTNVKGWLTPKENMSELHKYLGVSDDGGAKTKLREHLGEKNSLCDWGSEDGDRGGHLGSERRKVKALNEKLNKEIQDHKATALKLTDANAEIDKLKKQLASGGGVSIDPELWAMNGLTVEVTDGNKKTISNYKLKS